MEVLYEGRVHTKQETHELAALREVDCFIDNIDRDTDTALYRHARAVLGGGG